MTAFREKHNLPFAVIRMPDGSNVVERLLTITEKLLDFMLINRPDDVDTLTMISVLISFIANPAAANKVYLPTYNILETLIGERHKRI